METKNEQLERAKALLEMLKSNIAIFGPAGDDLARIAELRAEIEKLEA